MRAGEEGRSTFINLYLFLQGSVTAPPLCLVDHRHVLRVTRPAAVDTMCGTRERLPQRKEGGVSNGVGKYFAINYVGFNPEFGAMCRAIYRAHLWALPIESGDKRPRVRNICELDLSLIQ